MPIGYRRWRIRHAWLRFKWWITDPEVLRELSDFFISLTVAWIAMWITLLAFWAAGQ